MMCNAGPSGSGGVSSPSSSDRSWSMMSSVRMKSEYLLGDLVTRRGRALISGWLSSVDTRLMMW